MKQCRQHRMNTNFFKEQCLQNVREYRIYQLKNYSLFTHESRIQLQLRKLATAHQSEASRSLCSQIWFYLEYKLNMFSNISFQCVGDVCIANAIEWSADHQYQSNLNLTHMMSLHHTLHRISFTFIIQHFSTPG